MKALLLLPLLLSITLAAQDGGIVFQEEAFDALLEQARSEDKLIFVDAYTTWCGPCKMMVAKVFPDERVGEVYNERFINAKFDMEKGEGPGLASRYAVNAYPTYLFINGEGELVHKGLGYIPKDALLELADVAVSDHSLGSLRQRYEDGERSADFVRTYAETLSMVRDEQEGNAVIGEYLEGQEDWMARGNLELLLSNPGEVGGKRMRYLIEHAEAIDEKMGVGAVVPTVQQQLVMGYHVSNRQRNLVEPSRIADYYEEHGGTLADQLKLNYALFYYERSGDMESYLPAAMAYYAAHPSDDFSELNGVAWNFYEHAEDPEQLAQAIEWAERSVELNPYYPNLDTLAWLYSKTGQQEKAEATAQRAIEYAKAADIDYSDTEKIFQ